MSETVNHPPYYGGGDNPYEAIKVIEAWELDFCLGNSIKYISRAGKKNKDKCVEDLEKAKWYLERRIAQLKTNKSTDENLHLDRRLGQLETNKNERFSTNENY